MRVVSQYVREQKRYTKNDLKSKFCHSVYIVKHIMLRSTILTSVEYRKKCNLTNRTSVLIIKSSLR